VTCSDGGSLADLGGTGAGECVGAGAWWCGAGAGPAEQAAARPRHSPPATRMTRQRAVPEVRRAGRPADTAPSFLMLRATAVAGRAGRPRAGSAGGAEAAARSGGRNEASGRRVPAGERKPVFSLARSRGSPGGRFACCDENLTFRIRGACGTAPGNPGATDRRPPLRGLHAGGLGEVKLGDAHLAHLVLLHLAGDGHRELAGDSQVARDLVMGDLAGAELAQFLQA
jgi:hypothetical protein